jgi:hypothetical protein
MDMTATLQLASHFQIKSLLVSYQLEESPSVARQQYQATML